MSIYEWIRCISQYIIINLPFRQIGQQQMRPSRLVSENLKENQMINSRIQQSIKPFSTIREEALSASKFNQSRSISKPRRGISRVNSQQPIKKHKEEHRYSGKLSIVGISEHTNIHTLNEKREPRFNEEDYRIKIEAPRNFQSQNYNTVESLHVVREQTEEQDQSSQQRSQELSHQISKDHFQYLPKQQPHRISHESSVTHPITEHLPQKLQAPNSQFIISNKLKSLQSQLTIIQQQKQEKQKQLSTFKQRFSALERRLKYTEEQLNEQKSGKQREMAKNRQLSHRISEYEQQIGKLQGKISEMANQITNNSNTHNIDIDDKNITQGHRKIVQELQKQNALISQKYRQLLIKSSITEQERDNLNRKIQHYNESLTKTQEQNRELTVVIKQLEEHLDKLENKAKLADEYYLDLQNLYYLKKQHEQTKKAIQLLQVKNKEHEIMRADQTNQHFEQLRRIESKYSRQAQQDEKVMKLLRKEINELQQINQKKGRRIEKLEYQLERVREQSQRKEIRNGQKQIQKALQQKITKISQQSLQKDIILDNLKQDYESLIESMKNTLFNHEQINQKLIQENQELKNKVDFTQEQLQSRQAIIEKYNLSENANKNAVSDANIFNKNPYLSNKSPQKANMSSQRHFYSSSHANNHQNSHEKPDLLKKVDQYYNKITTLEDKIHIWQLQSEKARSKCQTYQRKIHHLEQQLKIESSEKEKLLNEKITISEELATLKQQLILKNNELQAKILKINELSQQIKKEQELNYENADRTQKLTELNHELEDQCRILEQRCQKNSIKIEEYRSLAQKNEDERVKYMDYLTKLKNEKENYETKHKLTQTYQKQSKQKENLLQKFQKEINHLVSSHNKFYNIICEKLQINYGGSEDQDPHEKIIKAIEIATKGHKEFSNKIRHLQMINKELSETVKAQTASLESYKTTCYQFQAKMLKMQESHQQKLVLVKEDYDLVYAKYLKYRNMAVQGKAKVYPNRNY